MVNRRAILPLFAVAAVALPMVLVQAVSPAAAQDDPNAAASVPDRPRIDTPDVNPGTDPAMGFATLELSVDPGGARLAAYQIEVRLADSAANEDAGFQVVGLEASDNPAFTRTPYYDLDARTTTTDRLILAQYSTADRGDLPTASFTVATAHLALTGDAGAMPDLRVTVTAAYDDAGKPVNATASYQLRAPTTP